MRNTVLVSVPVVGVLLLCVTQPGAAQTDTIPAPGIWGLRFAILDGGGGSLGAARFLTGRTSLGVDLRFAYDTSEEDGSSARAPQRRERERSEWRIGLTPEIRHYLAAPSGVVPFLTASLGAHYGSSTRDRDGRRATGSATSVRTDVGVAAEWFPTHRIGISGTTGVEAAYSRTESERDRPYSESEGSGWSVRAFRSASFLSLYF